MFSGLGVAVITPFKHTFEVDYRALEKILHHLIDHGADYLVMLGTTGESVTLSEEEKQKILQLAIKVNNKRLPIVAGIGGNNTLQIAEYIKNFDFNGIDGVLSVSPYYNKPNQNGIYRHYEILSHVCPRPIIIYNVPGRTSSNITSETTLKLATNFTNIIGIKEASGNFEQIMQIIKNKPEGFLVISGDDLLTLPQLAIGIDGVISVIANAFPAEFSQMIHSFAKDYKKSMKLHYQLEEYIRLIFLEGSPAGIKGLMKLMNFCEITVRPPLFDISEVMMEKLGILLKQN